MIAASTRQPDTRPGGARRKGISLANGNRKAGDRPGDTGRQSQPSSRSQSSTTKRDASEATLIVLGRDAGGKAHASWFGPADADLATKAAEMMGMTALSVATDELRALAGKLPQGRVFASGRAFVPFVRASLFDELVRHAPEANKAPAPKASATASSATTGSEATAAKEAVAPTKKDRPTDWSGIDVGHLVLASDGVDDGWWEATVQKKNAMGLLTLKWRDWPELGQFVRRSEDVALLHPAFDVQRPRS